MNKNEFHNIAGRIEDVAGKQRLCFDLNNLGLLEYQKRILEFDACKSVLSACIMEFDEERIYYDISGHKAIQYRLQEKRQKKELITGFLLTSLLEVTESLIIAEDHLLPAKTFSLLPETIFYNNDDKVKLLFLPNLSKEDTVISNMKKLINWMAEFTKDEEFNYLKRDLLNQIEKSTPSIYALQKILNESLRKMYQINWPAEQMIR